MDRDTINQLLMLDEEGLLSLLPAYDPRYEGTWFSPGGQLSAGREIFDNLKTSFHQRICVQWEFCKKKGMDKFEDPVILVASVADIIAGSTAGIPPFVISVLLFKIGLSKFCRCND